MCRSQFFRECVDYIHECRYIHIHTYQQYVTYSPYRTNGGSCYVHWYEVTCTHHIPVCTIDIIIHSAAGISRAVTISTMYVLTISTLKYEEALAVLQFSRKVANPNFGFRMQLKKYCREILEQV